MEALGARGRPMIVRMGGTGGCGCAPCACRVTTGLWLMLGHIPDLDGPQDRAALRFFGLLAHRRHAGHAAGRGDALRPLAEARDLAEALQEQTKAAERANAAKSAFLAAMSHEIRTPMNGVLGLAALLAGTELTASQREMLDVMIASGRLLMDILNDVLDLSKIESGAIDLEETALRRRRARARGGGSVRPRRLRQGAVARRGGGRTAALAARRSRPHPPDPVQPGLERDQVHRRGPRPGRGGGAAAQGGAVLEVVVCDTGIGMSAEAITRLFQPFVQADGSTTRRFGGTGLGLAIAKLLCDEMKGEVRVKSRLGAGLGLHRHDPARAGASPRREAAPERGERPGRARPPHVLVVEDNATNRFVLSLFLQKLGATFDMAQHGAEALIAWEGGGHDIVLMDIEMPVLDGLETTRELRRREQAQGRRRTPIIGLSADAMLEKPRHGAARGHGRVRHEADRTRTPPEVDRDPARAARPRTGARGRGRAARPGRARR
jgi:CheY-like chemotaxis protein